MNTMRTAEVQYHCPTCDQPMGIADVSLGEKFSLVFGCYCFSCKQNINLAFTLGYFQNQMKALYAREAGKPVRPPFQLAAPKVEFTIQDRNFLSAMRIMV